MCKTIPFFKFFVLLCICCFQSRICGQDLIYIRPLAIDSDVNGIHQDFNWGGLCNGRSWLAVKGYGLDYFKVETFKADFSIPKIPAKLYKNISKQVLLDKLKGNAIQIDLQYIENSFPLVFTGLYYAATAYKNSNPEKIKVYSNILWDVASAELNTKDVSLFFLSNLPYVLFVLILVIALLWYIKFTINKITRKYQTELERLGNRENEEQQKINLDFFTNIFREFRTPLTLIKGPIEFLQKNSRDLNQKALDEQYGLIQKNADYLMHLVSQFLDFRKIDHDGIHLAVRKNKMVAFIKEAVEPFQSLAGKQLIDFQVKASNEDLNTWFDYESLEKIVKGLLSNAFKYTPEHGKIVLEIFEEKDVVIVKVIDSGMSIPENRLQNIFEECYIEEDDDERDLQRTGIGLAFIKNIVEHHSGTLQITNNEIEGVQFIVKLLINKEAYVNIPKIGYEDGLDGGFQIRCPEKDSFAIDAHNDLKDGFMAKPRHKLPVLLIIDNNADIRGFIEHLFSKEYEVHTAENGVEGFNMACKIIPDIIITELLMPILNGFQMCKKIKATEMVEHIPIVILTSKTSQDSELRSLRIGAEDYIRKPFDTELLKIKIDKIVQRREALKKRFILETHLQAKDLSVISTTDEHFLAQATGIVEKNMMNTGFTVEMFVKEMGRSRSNLYLKLKETTGMSTSEFIRNIRLKRAMKLLEQSNLPVKEIMYMTGFNTTSYFAKCFKKQFGIVPSKYVRQKDKGKES